MSPPSARPLLLPSSDEQLAADLLLPEQAQGLVVFVHGSGSSRRSPRNQQVAGYFYARGLATLLFDLLTEPEQRQDMRTGELRFNIPLLTRRLLGVLDSLTGKPEVADLPIGLFGASTGAAAALLAAAERPELVQAVVSRGGRTDLARSALPRVQAATLQIVGGRDWLVLEINQATSRQLHCEQSLAVVPSATHLFEEPGTLEEVARLAADWFVAHLGQQPQHGT